MSFLSSKKISERVQSIVWQFSNFFYERAPNFSADPAQHRSDYHRGSAGHCVSSWRSFEATCPSRDVRPGRHPLQAGASLSRYSFQRIFQCFSNYVDAQNTSGTPYLPSIWILLSPTIPGGTEARRKSENGGFVRRLIAHTSKLLEEKEGSLCVKILQV